MSKDREAILSSVSIKLVEDVLSVKDLLPRYSYQFESAKLPSEESEAMYNNLVDFLFTNEELPVNENYTNREDYVKGFQRALAIVKLWIDSMYLEDK